jgi:hypothetical protein
MNTLFANGLFDNPWMVAILFIGGAIFNWLMKRRQEKEAGHPPEGEPPPVPDKPKGEFDLDEALRRLLDPDAPPKTTAPPPILSRPLPARPSSPAGGQDEEYVQLDRNWMENSREGRAEAREATVPTPPPLRPPPVVLARAGVPPTAAGEQSELAARRFEQLNEAGRHPAMVVGHGRGRRSRAGSQAAGPWRSPRRARQAFVASLVFGPPKGLEP